MSETIPRRDIEWPVVRRYRGAELTRIAMPIGGIGTGCVSLGGRGQLIDWELFNRPAKGFNPDSFFCVRTSQPGASGASRGETQARVLEIGLSDAEFDGPHGSPAALAGLPRFRSGEFAAAYPFGQVTMTDPDLPIEATVRAFNPLVPGDAEASGLPAVSYQVRIRNTSAAELEVSVCGTLRNVVGREISGELPKTSSFTLRQLQGATVLLGTAAAVPADHEAAGTVALAALGSPADSHRLGWARRSWGDSLLDFWDDFAADGRLDPPDQTAAAATGSLVQTRRVPPGACVDFGFLITWHFPNRRGWTHRYQGPPNHSHSSDIVGNHYTGRFADALDVVRQFAPKLGELEQRTEQYVSTVTTSSLPPAVQDAVLSNAAVLKSPTCFRIADGTFLAWEGCNPDSGSCHGSCTHVWNYQYALEQLFPELAWSMREVEFAHALDERGMMSFRAGLPLATEGTGWPVAAADGQMGALLRLYRTWQFTGRTDLLERHWPAARKAMEFAWIPLGWDADRDGVMEGCQHNTMDVEYYGPSGVNQSWYLAALAACVEMAELVGDREFAVTCGEILALGAAGTDADVWNGEYYQQRIIPAGSADRIARGLRIRYDGDNPDVGSDDLADPDLQIGAGCTSDQLVGHAAALLCGLDTGLDPGHTAAATRAVARHNHRGEFFSHVNHLRTYAQGDEHGLLNCAFPRGDRPLRPFPYCDEVWTGLEYTAAIGLALLGDRASAEHAVADVRARYSGRRRNPFNEVECGDHYVRSMASFGLAHAWPRTVVQVATGSIELDPLPGRWPVIVGPLVGQVEVARVGGEVRARFVGSAPGKPVAVRVRAHA
ncbi:GH116 family glycosyl-hydrolase [Catenulispora pinisilvae]|uniref:GH116 family glycosyl-hydrolase n=1 Tax=Catenulispora pinisilvae TaxID=2705253 RepID=UPI001890C94A|nr:GH116 family glycosyl-hydrolase [Catenulispora pinisilvae]